MDAMGDREGPRLVSSTALWRGERRPAQIVQVSQLEQDFQRAPQQRESGSLPFDTEYSRWLEEHTKHINELRTAVNSHASDPELRSIVDNVIAHYDEVYRMKANTAKGNVEHLLSGMWKTPAERCFMWIGDFRPSLLLKLLGNQLEPLSEQQLLAIENLQLSSHNSEDALSQGMQALEQSLGETLAIGSPFTEGSSGNVATKYMGQMEMAMGKLATLEAFFHQADLLRQRALHQMHCVLTTRQSARALLAISGYFSGLRALSSIWLARPREQ
ncbi:TGACG-sequence-specific DNA-binding protein TGA-2.1-like [Solanum tuberosum]|nr:PREDICTED: TGACG-sequence-specific DNA-binding protein TGA-2.1-like [Solanum tuberosum]